MELLSYLEEKIAVGKRAKKLHAAISMADVSKIATTFWYILKALNTLHWLKWQDATFINCSLIKFNFN